MEDNEKKEIVKGILIESLIDVYRIDYKNIEMVVSERNICARLAHYMENRMRNYEEDFFSGYFADVEYNRERTDLKKLNGDDITCDLLIQTRTDAPNLLAVEMKKKPKNSSVEFYKIQKEEFKSDRARLREMVSEGDDYVHNTLIGAFIVYSKEKITIEFFEKDENGIGAPTDIYKYNVIPNTDEETGEEYMTLKLVQILKNGISFCIPQNA